jgi:hypothetical protein
MFTDRSNLLLTTNNSVANSLDLPILAHVWYDSAASVLSDDSGTNLANGTLCVMLLAATYLTLQQDLLQFDADEQPLQ